MWEQRWNLGTAYTVFFMRDIVNVITVDQIEVGGKKQFNFV